MRFDCFGTPAGSGAPAPPTRAANSRPGTPSSPASSPTASSAASTPTRATIVPVSATMARLLEAVRGRGRATGGLVDGTLAREIEAAGYRGDLARRFRSRCAALAPPRARRAATRPDLGLHAPARRRRAARRAAPPGLAFDCGGLAKGLFADLIAERMRGSFAVDCGGDLRFGGAPRRLEVTDPFGGPPLHVFEVRDGAAATSGIGRRSWLDADGRPAHHLLDPATGRPAFTGVVQATALAPTALEAEWRAKAARAERRSRLAHPRRRARARRRNHTTRHHDETDRRARPRRKSSRDGAGPVRRPMTWPRPREGARPDRRRRSRRRSSPRVAARPRRARPTDAEASPPPAARRSA